MEKSYYLLSTQRSLLGAITPNMRAIAIDYDGDFFKLIVILEKEPNDAEIELIQSATSEIAADLPNILNITEEYLVTEKKISEIQEIKNWVFVRYEP